MKYSIPFSFTLILLVFLTASCAFQMEADPGLLNTDGNTDTEDGDTELDGDESETSTDGDGVDGDSDIEWPDITILDEQVIYDFNSTGADGARYNRVPWPSDYFTVSDNTKRTGLRVNVNFAPRWDSEYFNTNMIDKGLTLMSDRYIKHLNTLDGFSTFAFEMFEVYPDVDPATLPADTVASVADESSIWVIDIDKDSPKFGERTPVFVDAREAETLEMNDKPAEHLYNYIRIRPEKPFEQATKYALVVRNTLKTKDGKPLSLSPDFARVANLMPLDPDADDYETLKSEQERMAPVFEILEQDLGLDRTQLLLVTDFTTESSTADMQYISEHYHAGDYVAPQVNLDSSDPPDGTPDQYTYSTYPTDRFPSISGRLNSDLVGGIMHGTFKAVDWRLPINPTEEQGGDDARLSMVYDDDGNPIPQGEHDVPFVLIFPTTDHPQPYPVVVIQHGIGARKETEIGHAPLFLEKGWAVMAADFIYHGERGGYGMAALTFVNITHPLAAKAAFQQASSDHIQQFQMLADWDLDIYPITGEGDDKVVGDGVVDIDGTRLGYLGISLGGIVGSLSAAVVPEVTGFVLNVGGAGLIDFVADFMEQYGITTVFPDHTMQQFGTVAQTILEQGDGINYCRYYRDLMDDSFLPRSVLLQMAIPDDTVPNTVSENLARVADLPFLPPREHAVYSLEEVDGPVDRFGYSQYHPGNHNMIGMSSPPELAAEKERMHRQFVHFFETGFETGVPEIITGEE